MEAKAFSQQLAQAFNEFNPHLQLTVSDFRRNTITDLFAGTCIPKKVMMMVHNNNNNNNNINNI